MKRFARRSAALLLTAALLFGTAACGKYTETAKDADAVPFAESAETRTEALSETRFGSDIELPESTDLPSGESETQSDELSSETKQPTVSQTAAPTQTNAAPATEMQTELTVHIHMYTTKTVPATCTGKGYTVTFCACGDAQYTNVTDPLDHSFGKITELKAATCSENGVEIKTCDRCGETIKESTPKREHQMTDFVVVKAATGTETGSKTRRCKICGVVETVEIPKVRPYASQEAALELLRLVNASRAKAGAGALSFNHTFDSCALERANEIQRSFSHTRPNGKQFYTVIDEQGLARPTLCGENIQYATYKELTAAEIHDVFMNSAGHRENLLKTDYTSACFCVLYTQTDTYIVELFFG